MAERRLGAGLEALLGPAVAGTAAAESPNDSGPSEIPVGQIRPNPFQPRAQFDEAEIERLADSLKTAGLLQPVLVRPRDGHYELIAGERRWRAAVLAGWERIPAVVREAGDDDMLLCALVENIQRQDLDPIEKARAFRVLLDRSGRTQEELAAALGYDRATIANYLRLLDLPPEIQQALCAGVITMGHARALAALPDRTRQIETLRRIVREGLSVRAVEMMGRSGGTARRASRRHADPLIADLERRLADYFATRVRIRPAAKGGTVVIEYYDDDQFRSILARLGIV